MTFKRWLPTFLAFPDRRLYRDPGHRLARRPGQGGGRRPDRRRRDRRRAVAGAALGGIGRRWIGYTAAAMAAGSAISVAVTDAGTERADVMLAGLITGALVGAAQSTLLPRAARSGPPSAPAAGRSRG